jgi:Ankyrin repeats (3 copies)
MSESPPTPGEFDDVDEHYRRVTALEKGGPSESVRRAVLEQAARLAAERVAAGSAGVDPRRTDSSRNPVVNIGDAKRRTARQTWWRPAAVGTLAAAGLAGLLIAPQFLPPREAGKSASAPASAPPSVPPAAPESGAATLNEAPVANSNREEAADSMANAPAAEGALAKRQMVPAAPNKAAAQDALVAQDKLQAEGQGQRSEAGAAADSAEVPIEARRARSQAYGGAIASAAAPAPAPALQSAVPMAAARLLDPAAELRHAAAIGDMPALRAALERRPLIDARDADGRSALMLAVLRGRGEAVDALLAAGADPNAVDVHGVTPLHAALGGEQADIAAALRRAGAR